MSMRTPLMQAGLDAILAACGLLAMSYSLIGEAGHEWCCVVLVALVAGHLALNRCGAGRACGTALDWIGLAVRALLAAAFAAAMLSGLAISTVLMDFLPALPFTEAARRVHLVSSYWCLALGGVHAGLHAGFFSWIAARWNAQLPQVFAALLPALACWGAWVFSQRRLADYLLGQTAFAFIDETEPLARFLADYGAVACLAALPAVLLARWARRTTSA